MADPQAAPRIANDAPPLATLVLSGKSQKEAIAINDHIFMSQDVSNCYLITSPAGDVLVNAGTLKGGDRHKLLFAAHRWGPLPYIILTQGHPDHYAGVPTLREPGTQLIAQENIHYVRSYWCDIGQHYTRRLHHLWRNVTGIAPMYGINEPEPDITFDKSYVFSVGARKFELYSTPSGETLDSLIVWLPEEKTLFTGNLWGPVYMSVPNLGTIRGDKLRSVRKVIQDLDLVLELRPELLITGHGEPIRGAGRIADDLTRLRDAMRYLYDQTVDGMNKGKCVFTLMHDIKLPAHLQLLEQHGTVPWAVRTIFHEYTGWFHFNSATEMYDVPISSVNADIVDLAGGPDRLAERARGHIDKGRPLEALHLLEICLHQVPVHRPSLEAKLAAFDELQTRAAAKANLSEIMWIKAEMTSTREALEKTKLEES